MAWELAIVGGIIGICFILVYLSNNLDSDMFHTPIKLLLIAAALFIILMVLTINLSVIDANNDTIAEDISTKLKTQVSTAYQVVLWTTILYISYVLILFLITVLRGFREGKK
jgi:hypothetical protein